jgi:hypothetical protein
MMNRDETSRLLDALENRAGKPQSYEANGATSSHAKRNGTTRRADDSAQQDEDVMASSPPWPDTPKAEVYHGVAGEIVRAIEPHSEADPLALLVQLLTGVGSIVGRTAHFRVEGDTHYLNLFPVLVGKTSKGRKGTSWGRVRQYLDLVDPVWAQDRVQSGLASGEGLVDAVRDPVFKTEPVREKGRVTGSQNVEIGSGVADKRLLCLEEEYAGVLKIMERQGNSLSARIRESWAGRRIGSMTRNNKTTCQSPHISIIGHASAEEIRRYLTSTEVANGFGNRHLWTCVRRSKQLPHGGAHQPDPELVRKLQVAVTTATRLAEADAQKGELRRDREANQLWESVYARLSNDRPGLLGAVLGRAEAYVMRLAALYAVLDQAWSINAEHLHAALALWDYCEGSAKYIFGQRLGDAVADEILQELQRSPKGLSRTAIRSLFSGNRSSEQIGRALALLSREGLARCEHSETGGRPVETWYAVNSKNAKRE